MPRNEYDIYTTILNSIAKGENHKAEVEKAKSKSKK